MVLIQVMTTYKLLQRPAIEMLSGKYGSFEDIISISDNTEDEFPDFVIVLYKEISDKLKNRIYTIIDTIYFEK